MATMLMKECMELSEDYAVELMIDEYSPEEWAYYLQECEDEGGLAQVYRGMKQTLIQQGAIRIH